jgi:hypothetical protein
MKLVVYPLSCFLFGLAAQPMVASVALREVATVVPGVLGISCSPKGPYKC